MRTKCYSLLIVFLAVAFVACAPKVKGTIFLDENDNYLLDPGEKALGNVLFTVTVDDVRLSSGKSDQYGRFEVKTQGKGYYCVEVGSLKMETPIVTEVGTQPEKVSGEEAKEEKLNTKGVLTPKIALPGDKDGDGVKDEQDNCPDLANADQKNSDQDKYGDACDKCSRQTNEDNNSDGYADECEDAKKEEEKKTKQNIVDAKKSCSNVDFSDVSLDIPIPRDYAESLNQLPILPEIEASPGDVINLKFVYPNSCNYFKPIYLPPELQAGAEWSTQLAGDFSVVSPESKEFSGSYVGGTSYNITQDLLVSRDVIVTVKPDMYEAKNLTVEAEVICPDNSELKLSRTVSIKGGFPISVVPSITTSIDNLLFGQTFSMLYIVENESGRSFGDGDVEIKVSVPGATFLKEESNGCSNLVMQGEASAKCYFGMDAGTVKHLIFRFKLPQSDTEMSFESDTEIKMKDEYGESEKDVEETVRFTVYPQ